MFLKDILINSKTREPNNVEVVFWFFPELYVYVCNLATVYTKDIVQFFVGQ